MSSVFDNIMQPIPVDGNAARTASKGYAYVPDKKNTVREWEAPPPLRFPKWNALNLIGVKFGRLTVIGLDANKVMRKNSAPSWVCRCTCGRYTSRSAKAIRNPKNNQDRCSQCQHVAHLQRQGSRLGSGCR